MHKLHEYWLHNLNVADMCGLIRSPYNTVVLKYTSNHTTFKQLKCLDTLNVTTAPIDKNLEIY